MPFLWILVAAAVSSIFGAVPGAAQDADRATILTRVQPQTYDISCAVSFFEEFPGDQPDFPSVREQQRGVAGEFFFPVILKGSYHVVNEETVMLRALSSKREVSIERLRRNDGPFGSAYAVGVVASIPNVGMQWEILYRVTVSNTVFDERAAQQVTWPREWPKDVQIGLEPSFGIDSSDIIFKETVERVSQGRLRDVTPHIAAKELVRHAVEQVRVMEPKAAVMEHKVVVDPDTGRAQKQFVVKVLDDLNKALMLTGATQAARTGIGTQADLVAICIALLRAADIPARPVIGIVDDGEKEEHLVCWGEYYLPDVGWIPFDPEQMRSQPFGHLKATDAYPGFGGVRDLNQRIPIAYEFVPKDSAKPELFPMPLVLTGRPNRHVVNTFNEQRAFVGGWGHNLQPLGTFNAFYYPKVRIQIRPVRN